MRADQLMHGGADAPIVAVGTPMAEVIHTISSKGMGMTCVVDDRAALVGIITDGDLRRQMAIGAGILERVAGEVMTRNPITIPPEMLAAEILLILEQRKITSLVVADRTAAVLGVVHLHDLWRTEMF